MNFGLQRGEQTWSAFFRVVSARSNLAVSEVPTVGKTVAELDKGHLGMDLGKTAQVDIRWKTDPNDDSL